MPKTLVAVKCEYCGKEFLRAIGNINQSKKLGRKITCSYSCSGLAQKKHIQDLEKRFWKKVIKSDGCWKWKGGKHVWGYGAFWYQGRMVSASRISYMIHYGEIPSGMEILHKCDNPECTNPDHLVLGTHRGNIS